MNAVDDAVLGVGLFGKLDAVCAGVDGAGCTDYGTVDGFGAPDKVCAVAEGQEAGGQFADADHRRENDFVAIVQRGHFEQRLAGEQNAPYGRECRHNCGDGSGSNVQSEDDRGESTVHRDQGENFRIPAMVT